MCATRRKSRLWGSTRETPRRCAKRLWKSRAHTFEPGLHHFHIFGSCLISITPVLRWSQWTQPSKSDSGKSKFDELENLSHRINSSKELRKIALTTMLLSRKPKCISCP